MHFHMEFRIKLSIYSLKHSGIFIAIAWDLRSIWENRHLNNIESSEICTSSWEKRNRMTWKDKIWVWVFQWPWACHFPDSEPLSVSSSVIEGRICSARSSQIMIEKLTCFRVTKSFSCSGFYCYAPGGFPKINVQYRGHGAIWISDFILFLLFIIIAMTIIVRQR